MLRFNHIQKTAGNSLVSGLWEEFGKDRVYNGNLDLRDGGSGLVARVAREIDAAVVYTHGSYRSFKNLFYPEDTFVFFRDPVERAISSYNHYLRGGGRRQFKELITFDANFQSRMTEDMPLDRVFVGLTDQFTESLRRFNSRFGTNVREHSVNVNPDKAFKARYTPTEEELHWVVQHNQHDADLWNHVKTLFNRQSYVVSSVAPKFTREGTWDKQIFEQVVGGEYGPVNFTNKLVFDVGAHIGSFSYLAASKGARKVHAFEPGSANYELLKLNTAEFGSTVSAHATAVWRGGSSVLDWSPSTDTPNTGGAGVSPAGSGAVRVQARGLDSLIENYGLPDILKLDCEGAEYTIVPGSSHLTHIKLIVGEFHPPESSSRVLFEELRARGFNVEIRPTVDGFGHFTATRI